MKLNYLTLFQQNRGDRRNISIHQPHIEDCRVDCLARQKSQSFPYAGYRTDDFATRVFHGLSELESDERFVFGNQYSATVERATSLPAMAGVQFNPMSDARRNQRGETRVGSARRVISARDQYSAGHAKPGKLAFDDLVTLA